MLAVDSILMTEKRNLEIKIEKLVAEIGARPKGSLVHKIKGAQTYVYLAHREGPKVVTDYIGKPLDRDVTRLAAKIAERRRYQRDLLKLKPELARVERLIRASARLNGSRGVVQGASL